MNNDDGRLNSRLVVSRQSVKCVTNLLYPPIIKVLNI